jgi:hypothetical protein
MAFDFDGSTQYFTGTAPISVAPMSVSVWFNGTAPASGSEAIMSLCDAASDADFWAMSVNNSNQLRWDSVDTGGGAAIAGDTWTDGVWHNAIGVEIASNDRDCYLDNGTVGTDTTTRTPDAVDTIGIGARVRLTLDNHFNGGIAELGIWNVELSADDRNTLQHYAPPFVKPNNLVFYAPLVGGAGIDLLGTALTNNGSVAGLNDHPPVFTWFGPSSFPSIIPAGGGGNVPVFYHHYRTFRAA